MTPHRGMKITVLGLGNSLMGDDGVGPAVIDGLRRRVLPAGVTLQSGRTGGMDLIGVFLSSDLVIVVDGLASGAEPGTIFRLSPDQAGIMEVAVHNMHGAGIPSLLTAARLQGRSPEVIIFGIEIESLGMGDFELTPAVTAAARKVELLILDEIDRREEKTFPAPSPSGCFSK
jgi:hydrogenase maturation protease